MAPLIMNRSFTGAGVNVKLASKSPIISRAKLTIVASIKVSTNRYETMMVLRPDMQDDERDRQLAKFEAFLGNEGAESIDCAVKGRQRMAYPINGHSEGIYVLFQFNALGKTAQSVQKLLANPDAESQGNVLRWMTMRAHV